MKYLSCLIALLCATVVASCSNPPPNPETANQPLVRLWQTQSRNERDIHACLIKTRLPNPLAIPTYQQLIARIWESGEGGNIPVFYTHASNMNLYVILYDRCAQKGRVANELEAYLERDALLRDFRMQAVDAREASQVIAGISPADDRR